MEYMEAKSAWSELMHFQHHILDVQGVTLEIR